MHYNVLFMNDVAVAVLPGDATDDRLSEVLDEHAREYFEKYKGHYKDYEASRSLVYWHWNEVPGVEDTPAEVVRVLMTANKVQDKSTVTKRGGEKKYILRNRIEIYGWDSPDFIEANEGEVFLVADGTVNVIKDTTQLLVEVEKDEL